MKETCSRRDYSWARYGARHGCAKRNEGGERKKDSKNIASTLPDSLSIVPIVAGATWQPSLIPGIPGDSTSAPLPSKFSELTLWRSLRLLGNVLWNQLSVPARQRVLEGCWPSQRCLHIIDGPTVTSMNIRERYGW